MMISPEMYYEAFLEGKTVAEIQTNIRGLKNEIGHLKNIIEHPGYVADKRPSEDTIIKCDREYLERAKQALAEAGGVYSPSKAEQAAIDFDENIPNISSIDFSIGGFFHGFVILHLKSNGDVFTCTDEYGPPYPEYRPDVKKEYPKAEVFAKLRELHLGEWRKHYDPERFGYVVLDGTSWDLKIEFDNGHKPFSSGGSNSYPYNFDEFQEIFDAVEE